MNKMVYEVHNLPTVNEAGEMLETEGFVAFGRKAYNQTASNCLEIASRLAESFGYHPIKSRKELTDLILSMKSHWVWGESPHPRFGHISPVVFVVRTPDNPTDVHVALEAYGKEYNYGPGTKEGFPVEMRVPLYMQQK